MVNLIVMIMMLATSFAASESANPVKISVLILLYASILFFFMSEIHSSSWLAVIFYLLFMGGILMMFMILSSISPNEKTKSGLSKKMLFAIMITMMPMATLCANSLKELNQKMKLFMNDNSTVFFSVSLIVMYFFFFITLIEKEKSPMRTC